MTCLTCPGSVSDPHRPELLRGQPDLFCSCVTQNDQIITSYPSLQTCVFMNPKRRRSGCQTPKTPANDIKHDT